MIWALIAWGVKVIRHLLLAASAAVGLVGIAHAQCACGGVAQVTNGAGAGNQRLTDLLVGNTVCATAGSDKWQEFHSGVSGAANNLIDYKLGPTSTKDPTAPVGKWSITGTGTGSIVTYDYGPAAVYSYTVCRGTGSEANPGPPFSFCSTGSTRSVTGATMVAGQGACP